MTAEAFDLVIVGGGTSGLAAAVRAAADGLRTALLERGSIGGGLRELTRVEAVPGHPVGLSGLELAERSAAQARRFGAEIRSGTHVVRLRVEEETRVLDLADGATVVARSVILAPGTDAPELPVPGLRELMGSGVYLGLPMEIPEAVRAKDVFVAGDIAGAAEAALRMSGHCRSVVLLATGPRVSSLLPQQTVERLRTSLNVSVRLQTEIIEVAGVESLELVTLRDRRTGRITIRTAAALYLLELGVPRTSWLSGVLALDRRRFIVTGPGLRSHADFGTSWSLNRSPFSQESSLPGVFVAGGARAGAVCCTGNSIEEGIGAAKQATIYLRGLEAAARARRIAPPLQPR